MLDLEKFKRELTSIEAVIELTEYKACLNGIKELRDLIEAELKAEPPTIPVKRVVRQGRDGESREVIARKQLWTWTILASQKLLEIRARCPDTQPSKIAGEALMVIPNASRLIELQLQERNDA